MATSAVVVYSALFDFMQFPIPTPDSNSLVFIISTLTALWSSTNYMEEFFRNPNPFYFSADKTYDFIIVGGGSAGSVLANRLSESGKHSVLLLDAGGDPSLLNSIPELAPLNLHHPSTDWKYRTVPQTNCALAMFNREVPWPRGKALGGCSSFNWMIYQRGHPKDYEQWADETGESQWSYDELLPYFKRSESYYGSFPNSKFHGSGGPLRVSKQSYTPSLDEWVAAGKELGYDTTTDPNSYQVPGFWPTDVTIYNGERESTYVAYVKPALRRSNLKVTRYAQVIKIDLDDSKRATGVQYVRDGRTFRANARNEVIVSAGAIGSPHLLMLSGIGPAAHLQDKKITPIVDLPGVGKNLQDHVLTMAGFVINNSISFITDRDMTIGSALEYATDRKGPLSFNELSGVGFIATSQSDDPNWSNIEFHQSPLGYRFTAAGDFTKVFGLRPNFLTKYFQDHTEEDGNFVMIDLGRPKSVGEITLENSDPFTYPLIDPKYFSVYEDMEAMTEAMDFIIKFYENTKAWQSVGAKFIPKKFPGCEKHEIKSKAYLECYIRHMTLTIYHPCGTVKMGKSTDPMAVVDSNLRVIGVTGLRVVDASIMPKITNANLNAAVIMIGEKGAEFISNQWDASDAPAA